MPLLACVLEKVRSTESEWALDPLTILLAATRMTERTLKDIRNALQEKTVDILSGYRKSFSTSHPPGQLILPENLKEFSMYMLGLVKSRAFKGKPCDIEFMDIS